MLIKENTVPSSTFLTQSGVCVSDRHDDWGRKTMNQTTSGVSGDEAQAIAQEAVLRVPILSATNSDITFRSRNTQKIH